ncbi:MAG: transcription elongation factor GreB [Gammaproteobacteria bacterium]|nr:transcription elongation factor GreB [Gammaproteobacteria bacterium]
MGRYRPPAAPSSKYITPVGKDKLQKEHDYLWQKKRPEITRSVQEAAAQGDRSENAEYIYGKKQLREIDYRLRHLRKRLADITVVDAVPEDQERVFFGAWVSLEDEAGEIYEYRIVGPDEFDDEDEYISMDAPLAKAILKRRLDDEIVVKLPRGEKRYCISAIRYQ